MNGEMMSMMNGTMDSVFHMLDDRDLMDDELRLSLQSLLGQRDSFEINNMNTDDLALQLEMLSSTGMIAGRLPRAAAVELQEAVWLLFRQLASELGASRVDDASRVDEYEQRLRTRATQSLSSHNGNVKAGRQIAVEVSSIRGDVHLQDTIVLGRVYTTSGNITGKVHVAPGVQVTSSNGDVECTVISYSWHDLYEKARTLGIIT